jgi:hypothetical protein
MRKVFQMAGALALVLGIWGCMAEKEIEGGFVTEETAFEFSDFNSVEVDGYVEVRFTQGEEYSVTAEPSSDPKLKLYVKMGGKTLNVYTKTQRGVHTNSSKRPVVRISAPTLNEVECSGASEFYADNLSTKADLDLDVDGASKVEVDFLKCQLLKMDCEGASHLKIYKGECRMLEAMAEGASRSNADLKTEKASVGCSGAAALTMKLTGDALTVRNDGAGDCDIDFKGGNVDFKSSGAGKAKLVVVCEEIKAHNDGAARLTVSGSAAKTEFSKEGAAKIDSSGLNKR